MDAYKSFDTQYLFQRLSKAELNVKKSWKVRSAFSPIPLKLAKDKKLRPLIVGNHLNGKGVCEIRKKFHAIGS